MNTAISIAICIASYCAIVTAIEGLVKIVQAKYSQTHITSNYQRVFNIDDSFSLDDVKKLMDFAESDAQPHHREDV